MYKFTLSSRWELPTLGIAALIYGGFALVTWSWTVLPLWLAAPIAALLLAWHGSLQHETIHHHPTPWRRLNTLIGAPPLALWLPYERYRATHLAHHAHAGADLTDPDGDPESHYLPRGALARSNALHRTLRRWNATLAGRLLIGPVFLVATCWRAEFTRRADLAVWLRHALAVALLLVWLCAICRIPLAQYLALAVYPAISLGLLRSFAEHRAHPSAGDRTAVVEAGAFWSLLFLNNNLHVAHHRHPGLPWYRLPAAWRAEPTPLGPGMHYPGGYAEIVRRHLFTAATAIEHPGARAAR